MYSLEDYNSLAMESEKIITSRKLDEESDIAVQI